MTPEEEYLDRARFPLTNRGDLDLNGQRLVDEAEHEALQDLVDRHQTLTENQYARLKELEAKAKL